MDNMFYEEPNPERDAYFQNLKDAFDVDAMCASYGMKKRATIETRHAYHYANRLIDGYADEHDLGQILTAILRIEAEDIPNVPIVSFNLTELPAQVLREHAILLTMQAIIRGISEEEEEYLKKLLALLLTKDQLQVTWEVIQRIKKGPPEEVSYPVPADILEKNWYKNRDIAA